MRCVWDSGSYGADTVLETTEGETTAGIWGPALEGAEIRYTPTEQQHPRVYAALLRVERLTQQLVRGRRAQLRVV